jgi:predicted amidohydrolase
VYHTVALASPAGDIVARYRATHLATDSGWAKAGEAFVVVPTAIGRIALALGEELAVPELFGVYSAERADIMAAPAGVWRGPVGSTQSSSTRRPRPTRRSCRTRLRSSGQFWVAAAGWAPPGKPAGLLLGPEPVIATPPRVAPPGGRVDAEVAAPWSGTWINQDQLIDGQQPWNTLPLVLAKDNACLAAWRKAGGWKSACW